MQKGLRKQAFLFLRQHSTMVALFLSLLQSNIFHH